MSKINYLMVKHCIVSLLSQTTPCNFSSY